MPRAISLALSKQNLVNRAWGAGLMFHVPWPCLGTAALDCSLRCLVCHVFHSSYSSNHVNTSWKEYSGVAFIENMFAAGCPMIEARHCSQAVVMENVPGLCQRNRNGWDRSMQKAAPLALAWGRRLV